MSRVTVVSVVSGIAAAAFWVLAVVQLFEPSMQGPGRMAVTVALATAATVISAVYRLEQRREDHDDELHRRRVERDRDKAILIRTLADVVPERPLARTLPLHRVL